MRKVLVLGAGRSAPFLIHHLLELAPTLDLQVTVGDADSEAAKARVGGHERGRAIRFDLADTLTSEREFADADIVVHLLPPALQPIVARRCLEHRCHMVSASYRARELRHLEADARDFGVVLLCELGLDPGLDLMSAQEMIDRIHQDGGRVEAFASYGGGLPEPDFAGNPLRYCITWNPRNVVMAGDQGAQYLENGRLRLLPGSRVFQSAWSVDIPSLGPMDAYANRDSLSFRTLHGLLDVKTLVRATLRYPGFCAAWQLLVRLGLPNEHLEIPDLAERTWAELVAMFLPVGRGDLRSRTAEFLEVADDDPSFAVVDWLGLFSERSVGSEGKTAAEALIHLFKDKLSLPTGTRDLVVLHHDIEAHFGSRRQRWLSTFTHLGDERFTAMARTVGHPLALGVKLLATGQLTRGGLLSPTEPEIFRPILRELELSGLSFSEKIEEL